MDLASIRAELEDDRTWRQDEIRFLRNQLASMEKEDDKAKYRRAIIPMLYAHYEGFCKVALLQYVNEINRSGVSCGDATPAVTAASWERVFQRLENPKRKCDVFKRTLPDDAKLHRFARRRDFVEAVGELRDTIAHLADDVVDMESNLTPAVLKKALFKLDLNYQKVEEFGGKIDILLNRRNEITHGQMKDGLDEALYNSVQDAAFGAMEAVMDLVMQAIREKHYQASETSTPLTTVHGDAS